jgi:glyoxylase-like metal-dependent hydrolase (beta-lactamase superfamily II)
VIIQNIGTRSTLFTFGLTGWNLNIQLIEAEKNNYIIDTGLGSGSIEPVKRHINKKKPVIVINTHYHWDHVWGNWVFKDSLIVSHRLCREITKRRWHEMISRNGRYVSGEAHMLLPNLTFGRELKFEEDGIRLIYTPGHTADSISVLDEADRILNVGDNIGDTPEEIVPSLECPIEEYKKTLDMYEHIGFITCVSGHNEVMGSSIIERILGSLQRPAKG